ncbi:hypothetical protein [Gracilimonas mengyeensis]|nr:hypothetical protein [Gracilimonas mengyeensis]
MSLLLLQACSNSVSTKEDPGTTHLRITLPEDGHVHAWVENAYQTKVKTVVNRYLQKGPYSFAIKMEDKKGKPLPYGIYTYHVKTDTLSHAGTLVYSKPTNNY